MVSYREKWRAVLHRNLGSQGFGDVIARCEREGLFEDWRRLSDPGDYAARYLGYALDVRCGDPAHPYAKTFLEYALAIVHKAFSETERWEKTGDWGKPSGPAGSRRGKFLRAKALAEAMHANAAPDADVLLKAADGFSKEALGPGGWDEFAEGYYLTSVLLQLIAGDVENAKQSLRSRKRYRYVRPLHDWLAGFVDHLPQDSVHRVTDSGTVAEFEQRFDTIRDPDWRPERRSDPTIGALVESTAILRLEFALIKWRYLLAKPVAGHWNEVVEMIST